MGSGPSAAETVPSGAAREVAADPPVVSVFARPDEAVFGEAPSRHRSAGGATGGGAVAPGNRGLIQQRDYITHNPLFLLLFFLFFFVLTDLKKTALFEKTSAKLLKIKRRL